MTTDLQLDRDAARVVERNRPFLASFTMPYVRPMVRLRWVLRDLIHLVYIFLSLASFVCLPLVILLAPFWLISILRMHQYNRALRRLGLATLLFAAGLAGQASAFDAIDATTGNPYNPYALPEFLAIVALIGALTAPTLLRFYWRVLTWPFRLLGWVLLWVLWLIAWVGRDRSAER